MHAGQITLQGILLHADVQDPVHHLILADKSIAPAFIFDLFDQAPHDGKSPLRFMQRRVRQEVLQQLHGIGFVLPHHSPGVIQKDGLDLTIPQNIRTIVHVTSNHHTQSLLQRNT